MRPPSLVHLFRSPLPYTQTLALQENIHQLQLRLRREAVTAGAESTHKDVLLLLEHRPVFTAGRRQSADEVAADNARLTRMGADFVMSNRGGQLTYHGPGQLVGYPLWDLGRFNAEKRSVRVFVCDVLNALKRYMRERHDIQPIDANETGVFLNEHTKLASLGMQVRHRLTSHGFAVNIDNQPLPWFSQIVACGLADTEVPHILAAFEKQFDRSFAPLDLSRDGELEDSVRELELLGARMLEQQGLPPPPQ